MTAKRVVLELLTAADDHELSAAQLIAGAGVVDVSANNVRVTLTRLVAAGTLEVTGRGRYRLGRATVAMTAQITSWRDLERQVRKWDGGWAMAHVTGRDHRRDNWLELLGFRELAAGLHVRPDNLAGGVAALRDRVGTVFRATELDTDTDARAHALWDGDKLNAGYARLTAKIDRWLASYADLPLRKAAREAFVFGGGEVLHALLYDPRLPEPLVDVSARAALVAAMVRLDRVGRALWTQLAEELPLAA